MISKVELTLFILALMPLSLKANAEQEKYMAAIQFAIQGNSPDLMRNQRIVEQQFAKTIFGWPELKEQHYDVRTFGNEVIFYFVSDNDMRVPMQKAVSVLIQNLARQQFPMHGRSVFYRTAITNPIGEYKVDMVDDGIEGGRAEKPKLVRSIYAQSAPLRDLLKDIKRKVRGTFSYIIPSECGDKAVDWSFGQTAEEKPKSVKAVMTELAGALGLRLEETNNGTYFRFIGSCSGRYRIRSLTTPEIVRERILPVNAADAASGMMNAQFFLPLPALGD